ncbi:MAG TPA: hypothetical protein VJ818_02040 [Actinomycetota bacterium]|nr:hypothetical protein [Actinomycetota bacterium]
MNEIDERIRQALRSEADAFEPAASFSAPAAHKRARMLRAQALVWFLIVALVATSGTVLGVRASRSARAGTFVDAGPKHAGDPHFNIARTETERLLDLFEPPAGAQRVSASPSAVLASPAISETGNFIYTTRWWTVAQSYAAVKAWIPAHVPPGLVPGTVGGSGHGPGYEDATFTFDDPQKSDAYEQATLQVTIVSLSAHVTGLRADGTAVWLSSRPATDNIKGQRARVTIAGGCPKTFDSADISNPPSSDLKQRLLPSAEPTSAIRCHYVDARVGRTSRYEITLSRSSSLDRNAAMQLAKTVNGLPLASAGAVVHMCPADILGGGSNLFEIIVFRYSGRPDVDIYHSAFCWGRADNGYIMTTRLIPVF